MLLEERRISIGVLICLVVQIFPVFGQEDTLVTDPASYLEMVRKDYGLDQSLVSGVQYFLDYGNTIGHPYFFNPLFRVGSLSLNGQYYSDQRLQYDLTTQKVELEYTSRHGSTNRIFVVSDFLDGFSLDSIYFEKLDSEDGGKKFYQVIRTNNFVCYIYWEKRLITSTETVTYTEEDRSFFLEMQKGERQSFSSNKEFSKFFPVKYQKEIRRYLRKNSFKFQIATPEDIIQNINGVSNLLEG